MSSPWWEVDIQSHEQEENSVSQKLRLAVFKRDGWQCQYCGEADLDRLTVHHVIFRSQGGRHKVANLVTLCGSCHMRIHKRELWVWRKEDAWYFRDTKKIFYYPGGVNAKKGVSKLVTAGLRRYFRRNSSGGGSSS